MEKMNLNNNNTKDNNNKKQGNEDLKKLLGKSESESDLDQKIERRVEENIKIID